MKKRSLKTRLSAVMLAAAMVVSVAAVNPAGSKMSTVDAANKKVYYITQAKNDYGDTIKYTYNKNGTLKKSVATRTSKSVSQDTKTTTTTTYSYNKKNNISSMTEKTVNAVTSYKTDYSTGLVRKDKIGTVNDITTTVTKYKYNKKNQVTQTVATTTFSKTGSKKTTSISSIYDKYNVKELNNGKLLAGYNDYNVDGTRNDENTSKNAYYFEPVAGFSFANTKSETTTTTTYTDKGGGKYSKKVVTQSANANYATEENCRYFYRTEDDNDNEIIVELTKLENDPDGYSYKDASGKKYWSYDFRVITSVSVKKDDSSSGSSTSTDEEIISDKTVTTTKYTYDKKSRIKKATVTSVSSENSEETYTSSSNSSYKGYDYIYDYDEDDNYTSKKIDYTRTYSNDECTLDKYSYESTRSYTEIYTYDNKGRAKKIVKTNDGKTNTKSTSSTWNKSHKSNTSYKYADGKSKTSSESYTTSGYPSEYTVVIANGKKTITNKYNSYTKSYTESSTNRNGSSSSSTGTINYTYFTNGASKAEDNYTEKYDDGNNYAYTATCNETDYKFDKEGKSYGHVYTVAYVYKDGSKDDSSSAYYYDGKDGVNGVTAMTKIEAEKAKFAGNTFVDTEESKDKIYDYPSKNTATISYDKKGNVSSIKNSGYETTYKYKANETYGNTIYAFNSEGIAEPIEDAVKHNYTDKSTKENTVKSGSKSLSKVLTMMTSTYDGSSNSGYSLKGRVVYTVKSKKLSKANATITQKQQWILQNGHLSGTVGL